MTGPSRRRLVAALSAAAVALAAGGAGAEPGDELTVTVLTFGPGDAAFEKFGHDAIWIHDDATGDDHVYNFGTFSFGRRGVLLEFFTGRFAYWLSRGRLAPTLRVYERSDRSIDAQELELTAAQKRLLRERLEDNRRPENRHYKYDYYRDNCATRVRDAIDGVIGGRIRAASGGPARLTYRDHTLRLTADAVPVYVGLDLAMGELIDRPITEWDEAFLPERLAQTLRRVTVVGPDGELPLVRSEKRLFEARRARPPDQPPPRVAAMAVAGGLAGAALAALGAAAGRGRAARIAFGVVLALVGLVLGALGCLFLLGWALTDHAVTYRNENVLQCAPWAIALAVAGGGVARGTREGTALARRLVLAAMAAALLGLALKATPWLRQDNTRAIALLLPVWIGAGFGVEALTRRASRPASAGAEARRSGSRAGGAGAPE